MTSQLSVYLGDRHVGNLRDVGNAQLEFNYTVEYLNNPALAISNSLPLRAGPFADVECRAFFAGLLPDDQELDNLARHLKISRNNVFQLLSEVGGECAGAVSLFNQGQESETITDAQPLTELNLEKILLSARVRPIMGADEKVRLSLAGAQTKIAVVMENEAYFMSSQSKPSTHIIKPPSKGFDSLVQNEYFCMQLAKAVGIAVPESAIVKLGETYVYRVQRYDRNLDAGIVKRVHQEDFCQALNISPENKYEPEGGPSLQNCFDLIVKQSAAPALDYQQLLDRIIFNYLIGNNDAHGKNFSLIYKQDKPRLAPAYDLVCTSVYPDLNQKMAMKIGGRNKPEDLQLRHWQRLVTDTSTAKRTLIDRINRMCKRVTEALEGETEQQTEHEINVQISEFVRNRIDRLTAFNSLRL
jgi:serine/threonine-protein kinase HipA